ncbi:MAG: vWA domain-containing protein [Gammaproteobacteria bacterium]
MAVGFSAPWFLLLGLLALLPLLRDAERPSGYSSITLLPRDWLSALFFGSVRLIAALVVIAIVIGLADPYLREYRVKRIGNGAQIVLLLDRSASMNENFASRYLGGVAGESKVAVARQVLSEFVQRRQNDFFGMISFSTAPIYVLPLMQDKTAIIAAINATQSRGRGVTNIAPGLAMALDYFSGREQTGSRVILLVSDGAARIEPETQAKLTQLFKQNNVMLYWIYLRTGNSPRLGQKPANANESTTPEYFLHQYFLAMGIPYQSFEAEDPAALENAIRAIEKLENKPLIYDETVPRQSLAAWFYTAAAMGLLLLAMVRVFEIKTRRF